MNQNEQSSQGFTDEQVSEGMYLLQEYYDYFQEHGEFPSY